MLIIVLERPRASPDAQKVHSGGEKRSGQREATCDDPHCPLESIRARIEYILHQNDGSHEDNDPRHHCEESKAPLPLQPKAKESRGTGSKTESTSYGDHPIAIHW